MAKCDKQLFFSREFASSLLFTFNDTNASGAAGTGALASAIKTIETDGKLAAAPLEDLGF